MTGEECDDGNMLTGDGCSDTCMEEYDLALIKTLTGSALASG
jgi:hypothetical protein